MTGARAAVAGWMTGVQSLATATATTVSVPREVPTRPPSVPSAPDSARNCAVMWRPRAPSARRSPISPVRSITATSVVLAMPTVPISRQMAASSRKSWSRSPVTLVRSALGSGGGTALKYPWCAGSRAVGASWATCAAAPTAVSTSIFAPPWGGPQTSCAVLRGTTTDSSRSACRSTSSTMPTTLKASPPMKTAGRVSSVVMPSWPATPAPITATRWLLASCQALYTRPSERVGTAARRTPEDAATTWIRWPPGAAATGADRTVSVSASRTVQYTPALRTPLRAATRASASWGKARSTNSFFCRATSSTATSVALSALKRSSICEDAVAVSPRMATNVPTPRTVPIEVSAERAGRCRVPARASEARSRGRSTEGATRVVALADRGRNSDRIRITAPPRARSGRRHGWPPCARRVPRRPDRG